MTPDFTPAEKKVLQGLVEHPTLNDRELSEKIGIKPSTTTAVRRRLREHGVFCTKRVPMGHKLGYEILAVGYGGLKPTLSKKHRQACMKWIEGIPNVFLSVASSDSILSVAYLKNYSAFREYAERIYEEFGDSELFDTETWVPVIFSFEACKLLNFLDYGPAVRMAFGNEREMELNLEFEKIEEATLSNKEKNVLRGLVKYPEFSDKAVSEKIGASRQAVSSMKKRFEETGIMKTIRVVNLEKIGYQILGVVHSLFAPQASMKRRRNGIVRIQESIPSLLSVASNPENVMVATATSYDEYHEIRKAALKFYMGRGYLQDEPRITLFPLSDTVIVKDHDFSGIVDML